MAESRPHLAGTVAEKLEKSRELKLKGNEFFKQQNFRKAMHCYHSALLYLKGINQDISPNLPVPDREVPHVSEGLKADVSALTADLHNNLAACLLKQEPVKYERVVECCEKVTAIQPSNVKAWYRLGLARHHLRDNDAAKEALLKANEISGGKDGSVRKLLATVEQELKKESQKFKDMFKNTLLTIKS